MPSLNILMLQTIAKGLNELIDDVVFIGGAVTELYMTDPASSYIRPTMDVDFVVEISSRIEFNKLEEKLRTKGFRNDTSINAPICRWIYKKITVDIMPTNKEILGFTNKWYVQGIKNKIQYILPDETVIYIFKPEYFLATKLEAFKTRGGKDFRQSHDFEDIIFLLDNCSEILDHIINSNLNLKQYLKEEFKILLTNINITEGIECALPYGSVGRIAIIEELMREITKI